MRSQQVDSDAAMSRLLLQQSEQATALLAGRGLADHGPAGHVVGGHAMADCSTRIAGNAFGAITPLDAAALVGVLHEYRLIPTGADRSEARLSSSRSRDRALSDAALTGECCGFGPSGPSTALPLTIAAQSDAPRPPRG